MGPVFSLKKIPIAMGLFFKILKNWWWFLVFVAKFLEMGIYFWKTTPGWVWVLSLNTPLPRNTSLLFTNPTQFSGQPSMHPTTATKFVMY